MAEYLGNGLLLTKTNWGGHIVVPGYNVDVAVGILRDGVHEAWTTRLVQELLRPGETYINVGANFGYFTTLGAQIVGAQGKVIAIEANPHVFAILMKTMMWSGTIERISAYNRAAYIRSDEELEFTFDYQFIGGGHLRHVVEGLQVQTEHPFWSADSIPALLDKQGKYIYGLPLFNFFKVKTLCLDEITVGISADVIHCDVEQAEPYVLMGAQKLLNNSPNCKLIFEWSGHSYKYGTDEYRLTVKKMWELFEFHGFRVKKLRPIQHEDGAIELSQPLDFDTFIISDHGDYIAIRPQHDPWS
jgi:FkbM family methyltransferase